MSFSPISNGTNSFTIELSEENGTIENLITKIQERTGLKTKEITRLIFNGKNLRNSQATLSSIGCKLGENSNNNFFVIADSKTRSRKLHFTK